MSIDGQAGLMQVGQIDQLATEGKVLTETAGLFQTESRQLENENGLSLQIRPETLFGDLSRNILETGHQPFIQIAYFDGGNTAFINCTTQQDLGDFIDRLEKHVIFERSYFFKGISASLRGDYFGASEHFFDWIEFDDQDMRVDVLTLKGAELNLPFGLDFPAYHAADLRGLDANPTTRTANLRVESLASAVRLYDSSTGNDWCRWCLIQGAALALGRYYAAEGELAKAEACIEIGLKYEPKSIYFRPAQHAVGLKRDGKPVPPRLAKFIGRDNGALKDVICPEPFKRFDIGPSGEVLICCGHWVTKPIGNILNESADEILNSTAVQEIRASMLDGSYKYCNHLECTSLIHGILPKKAEVTEPFLRQAIDENKLTVDSVKQILFAFDQTCNLSCPSCRTSLIIEKPSQNEAKTEAVATKLMPLLSGLSILNLNPAGEVFASKPSRKLLEIVSKESCPNLVIDIISNGMLFSRKEWEKFPNLNGMIRSVRISTDAATKLSYESLRRLGVWETFVANMKFLAELREEGIIPELKFSFTYQLANFREMIEFVHFVRQFKCDFAIFERLQNLGAFSWEEFREKAVHLSDHPLHGEFLEIVRNPIFQDNDVWHDFEWEGVAALSLEATALKKPRFSRGAAPPAT